MTNDLNCSSAKERFHPYKSALAMNSKIKTRVAHLSIRRLLMMAGMLDARYR